MRYFATKNTALLIISWIILCDKSILSLIAHCIQKFVIKFAYNVREAVSAILCKFHAKILDVIVVKRENQC